MDSTNIYAYCEDRFQKVGIEYADEYFTNCGMAYVFKTFEDVIRAMKEVLAELEHWGLDGEWHIMYSQRFDFDKDKDADEKNIYKYRIVIEEL